MYQIENQKRQQSPKGFLGDLLARLKRQSIDQSKILWRVLFWSGLLCVAIGASSASYTIVYVNTGITVQPNLAIGVALIILGAVAMIAGYFVRQRRMS